MVDSPRGRIKAAFEEELATSPVPPGLRPLAVRGAVAAPRHATNPPRLLALVAVLVAFAVVATLVIGSHALRQMPNPAHSTAPPAPRAGAGVAYDQAHGVMVLFGGTGTRPSTLPARTPTPPLNDTWTWDGTYWTHQHPSVSPPPSSNAAMAYDEARHDVVLFGGAGLAPADSTWTWNGSTWRQMHPLHSPVTGYAWQSPAMQFDPITRTVLLYGFTPNYQSQTWSWNGSDWTQLAPATSPAEIGTMAFDGRHVLLLAGSHGQVGGRYITQTWAWDGAGWKLLSPKVNLPVLGFASSAYDARHAQLVLVTGDTWTWDGSTWARQHPSLEPPVAGYMAYIPSLREIVSWGDVSSSYYGDMYAWDGANWTLRGPPGTVPKPPPESGKGVHLGPMPPDQAAATVSATVTNTRPVLLPSSLPPGGPYDAFVTADVDGFNVQYRSDLRDKDIEFGIVAANPPPPTDPHARLSTVRFHGVTAQYEVYDTTSAVSQRWLMWNEPGSMANSLSKAPGVPYFLSTSGLTDQEFWQLAKSLR